MADVTILRETRLDPEFPLSRNELNSLVDIILESLGLTGDSFVLKLVDDKEIARLNKEFLGCKGPTNILSFPSEPEGEADTEQGASVFMGELALSVDALSREADLYGQPPVAHLARLLAHGILHLAGYDHGDEMYDLTDAAVDTVLLHAGQNDFEDVHVE